MAARYSGRRPELLYYLASHGAKMAVNSGVLAVLDFEVRFLSPASRQANSSTAAEITAASRIAVTKLVMVHSNQG